MLALVAVGNFSMNCEPTSPHTSTYPTTQPSTTAEALSPATQSTPTHAHPTSSMSAAQPTDKMSTVAADGSSSNDASSDDSAAATVVIAAAVGAFAGAVFIGVIFIVILLVWKRQQRQANTGHHNAVITHQSCRPESAIYCDIDRDTAHNTKANAKPDTRTKPLDEGNPYEIPNSNTMATETHHYQSLGEDVRSNATLPQHPPSYIEVVSNGNSL